MRYLGALPIAEEDILAMPKPLVYTLIGACLMCASSNARAQTLTPVPLHMDVPVSDIGNDNSLATPNTSRKLAVAADGTIYALFRSATNGIRVARSTDRGQSFGASVQVTAVNAEAEIGIASDGDLHVTWIAGGNIQHSISRDGGATFSAAVAAGSGATSVHMALDGDRVYLIPRNGSVVRRSSDDGATFTQTTTGSTYAFSDIFVDPLTRQVLLIVDSPAVSFYVSSDFAQTFAGPTATGKSVTYSVGALAATDTNRYLFIAGSGTNLERIETGTPAYFTATVAATSGSTTRSLSADVFGNVVSGYLQSGTNDLKFVHSNDLAVTFGSATTVVTTAARANAAINTINGDILFLYEKTNQIFLSTYSRGLIGYDINVAPSALNFGSVEINTQSSLPVQLSNVTGGPIAVSSFMASTGFSLADDCGGSIAAGASCTVTVTFGPTAAGPTAGVLTMTLGGVTRKVALSGTGTPARQPTSVLLDASATTVNVGDSVTLGALAAGSTPTGNVSFTSSGASIPGCSAVALSNAAASCTVSGLTAGQKQFAATYSGDATNAPSSSTTVTVVVGSYAVTPTAAASGSLNPSTPQTVVWGNTAAFTVTPNSGYRLDTVSGCGGSLSGSIYTTGPVTADCTVAATFSTIAFTVTPNSAAGGSITPSAPQSVALGTVTAFTVAPNTGYRIDTASGCGGTLSGTTYTTGAVTADCAVTATFSLTSEVVEVVAKSKGGGGAMDGALLLIGLFGVFARRALPWLFASLLVLSRAHAEESRWVVGSALGQAKGQHDNSNVAADLARRGFTANSVAVEDLDRTAYRLFAGYRITANWAVEVGYTDLGDVPTSANATVPAGQAEAYARALLSSLPVSASGYEASCSYRYPFGDAFAFAVRAGAWRWENDQRASFGNQRLRASPDGTDVLFGVGLEWNFAAQWAVGAEASRYRTDHEDFTVLAANVKFLW